MTSPRKTLVPLVFLASLALAALPLIPPAQGAPGAGEGRVVVLGFDGASHATVESMIAQGRLPNLAQLARAL